MPALDATIVSDARIPVENGPATSSKDDDAAPSRRNLIIALIGLTAIFGYLFIYHYHHESKDHGAHLGDFRTFYQAGQFAREHRDIYEAGYNDAQKYVYPPLTAVAMIPLTYLPEVQAAHVALAVNWLMLLGSLLLAARAVMDRLPNSGSAGIVMVAFIVSILSENEMRAELTMLETDALMLLMFTLALWWLDKKPILAGLALALAFNVKYLPIVALPYLLVRRRWTVCITMILGIVFFSLAPALELGWQENMRCLRVSMGGLLRWVGVSPQASHSITVHNITDLLSISITSGVARVLAPRGVSNTGAMIVATCIAMIVLAVIGAIYRRHRLPLWRWPSGSAQTQSPFKGLIACEWAGVVTAALCFSPDTNNRHLVLAALVNTLAAILLLTLAPGRQRVFVLAAAILIAIGFIMPIQTRAVHHIWCRYGIACWSLLVGYVIIANAAIGRCGELIGKD